MQCIVHGPRGTSFTFQQVPSAFSPSSGVNPPTAMEAGRQSLSGSRPRLYSTSDVTSEGTGGSQWGQATAAAALGATCALLALGCAFTRSGPPPTAFHVAPAIQRSPAAPPPPGPRGASARRAHHVPLQSTADPDPAAPPPSARPYGSAAEAAAAADAASKALDAALDKAEVILMWVLQRRDVQDVGLADAETAVRRVAGLVQQRRAAVRAAPDPPQAQALLEKAERKQRLLDNVLSAMRRKQAAEQALGAFGPAAPAPGPKAALYASVDEAQAALDAASEALNAALDEAEGVLVRFLRDDEAMETHGRASDITMERAEEALRAADHLVQQRKAAAKRVVAAANAAEGTAAAPERALAAAQASSRAAAAAAGREVEAAEAALQAAREALATALDRAEVILMWLLGDDAEDMQPEKAERAVGLAAELVLRHKAAADAGPDRRGARALVEKAEMELRLLVGVREAMLQQQDAEAALARAKGGLPSETRAALNDAEVAQAEADGQDPLRALELVESAQAKQLLIRNVVSAMVKKRDAEQALRAFGLRRMRRP